MFRSTINNLIWNHTECISAMGDILLDLSDLIILLTNIDHVITICLLLIKFTSVDASFVGSCWMCEIVKAVNR